MVVYGHAHGSVRGLMRRYILVYALGTFGDWIQGAYLYAAYRQHGLVKRQIGYIYILGYVVSATLGTAIASLGDVHGHKGLVVTYGALYAASCLLLRSSRLVALVTSRVLGGIAYSLLFSSFESWVITEADALKIDRKKLVGLFSVSTLFNGASAVVAGLVGNTIVELTESSELSWIGMDTHRNGLGLASGASGSELTFSHNAYTPVFDIAAVSLFVCAALAQLIWKNRSIPGDDDAGLGAPGSPLTKPSTKLFAAVKSIIKSKELCRLGLANSLYEAALHLFVFVWTPILEKRRGMDGPVPYGVVFSAFMVCKMIGSQVFSWLEEKTSAEKMLRFTLLASAVSFAVTVPFQGYWLTLCAFCVFEFGLGIYWPSMAVLRAKHVPNSMRATMTSAFRIPLNVLVVVLLLFASRASDRVLLATCSLMMIVCFRL